MRKLLIGLLVLSSMSAFAQYKTGKGKITATAGFYPSAENSIGVNLKITGDAAKILYDNIAYSDVQSSSRSGFEVRQTDYVKCIKDQRSIECRLLMNSDGTPSSMAREQLNF